MAIGYSGGSSCAHSSHSQSKTGLFVAYPEMVGTGLRFFVYLFSQKGHLCRPLSAPSGGWGKPPSSSPCLSSSRAAPLPSLRLVCSTYLHSTVHEVGDKSLIYP